MVSGVFETHLIEGKLWEDWLHKIRRFEFDRMMEAVPLGRAATVLELGSGDGFQLGLLRGRFERVCAIDPERRPACSSGFVIGVAEALPFRDGAFDLVSSCCVMEHLNDRSRGIEEIVRVLRPGGYMVHTLPARFWKAASLLLNPPGYALHVAGKWSALRKLRRGQRKPEWTDSAHIRRPGIIKVLARFFYPAVHGTYPSHLAEYRSYGRNRWVELFTHAKLVRVAEVPLLSYSPFGLLRFRLLPLRAWMGQHGFASSYALILRKVE